MRATEERIMRQTGSTNWQEVQDQFADKNFEQVKADLDQMFPESIDVNGELAQEIVRELEIDEWLDM